MKVEAFRPVFFNTEWQKSISPPYDIITESEEVELKKFPFNITHITLPENNEKGEEIFHEWLSRGVLYKYSKNIIIVILQKFEYNGESMERYYLMAPVQTSPPGNDILTHENTFDKFVNERKDLMRRTRCQPEPIFLLSEGGVLLDVLRRHVASTSYQNSVEEPMGVFNYIYLVEDGETMESIISSISDSKGVVADGHHRLRATRELYEEEEADRDFWKFSLSYVAPADQNSLLVLGIHRILKNGYNLDKFMNNIAEYFDISKVNDENSTDSVILYDGRYYRITPKENAFREAMITDEENYPASDPTLIDRVLIGKVFGIGEKSLLSDVAYEGNVMEAKNMVDRGDHDLAIIMPPWQKDRLFKLLDSGVKLPRKSTYFFPKIPSGIALYS